MTTWTSIPDGAEPSIAVTRDIPAPAGRIFSVLTRPVAHPDVDGSGMVRTTLDDVVISKVGDVFAMNMVRENVDYVMENHVVELEPDRRIVWEPVRRPADESETSERAYYLWGWRLEPLDADHTRVTELFDCSRSPDWLREAVKEGEGWRPAIEASLDNLEKLVAGS
jgi:uncharacterized protein YndB with AHSA1/START domain